jgi:glycerophosphoryl diester phosphodiesterase
MHILAHRGNVSGRVPSRENSFEFFQEAMRLGFGLELDVRREAPGRFYLSHDPAPWSPDNALDRFRPLFSRYEHIPLAVNVKELGYEDALIELMREGVWGKSAFYFDFELLEPETPGQAQRRLAGLPGGKDCAVASRLSDRGETLEQCLSIPGQLVWADEFDSLWITRREVEAVRKAGRKIYLISPELHGFPEEVRKKRWKDFKEWGIDGLCTDYSLAACDFFLG